MMTNTAIADINILEKLAVFEARESFYAYRRYINGRSFKIGWWVEEVCGNLQKFYEKLVAGEKPILIIQAPPQHGKSVSIIDFLSWLAGKNPDLKTIFSSYSDRLGIRANLKLQRILDSERYKQIFPATKINSRNSVTISGQYLRNREVLEYVDKEGGFRNTTVRGSVTGESLDLGVIDDPIKGREEANSPTIREKTWDWFTDDFYSRFSEAAGLLIILTRWHLDDPVGRLLKKGKEIGLDAIKLLSYEAIAEKDEPNRKEGEALFPDHKSLEFLKQRKKLLHPASWDSLYQQNPVILGGNLFKDEWWKWWTVLPEIEFYFIIMDTAQKTKDWNDFTDMQAWAYGVDRNIYLVGHINERFEAPALETESEIFYKEFDVKRKRALDPILRAMYIEDKSSGSSLIQNLKAKKLKIKAVQRNTDKISRAFDTAPYIEAGRVYLNKNISKIGKITDEGRSFPNGKFDDAIDNLMAAVEVAFINKEANNSLQAAMEAD